MKDCRGKSYLEGRLTVLFFFSLALGALYFNLFASDAPSMVKSFSVHEKNMNYLLSRDWQTLFVHIFQLRLIQLIVVWVLSCFLREVWVLYLGTAVFAFLSGILIAVETMSLGAVGMLYGICVWLPQGLLYGLIFYLFYLQTKRSGIPAVRGIRGVQMFADEKAGRIVLGFVKMIVMVTLLALGSLVEACINPYILFFCNQHLVPVIFL